MVAGASLEQLTVEGVEDVEAPVVLRYAFTAPGVASRQGERLVFDGMFHTEAARTWAEAPTRTVALWNGDPVNATLDLDVTLPAGARIESVPEDETGEAPGARWSLRWSRAASGFSLRRAVQVPTGRVSVADYPRFAASVRALDTADTRRVLVTVASP
jgi:hypothetical protein